MELDALIRRIQSYLENSPLVVFGSGATIDYGLPSMSDLGKTLEENSIINSDKNFDKFLVELNDEGLESAINTSNLSCETQKEIRKAIWKKINERDLDFYSKLHYKKPQAVMDLIQKVITATPNQATFVTTNYDRIIEYSADMVDATSINGFEGNLIKKLEMPSRHVINKRIRARERIVNIWKVHGSLDWFSNQIGLVEYPMTRELPIDNDPLIIPPGKNKYLEAAYEPFRSIIAEADQAFNKAKSFLCVGYGFNDEHIQPKLITQIRRGKPIVVLTKKMTQACRDYVVNEQVGKFLIIEEDSLGKTHVVGQDFEEVFDGEFWKLSEFVKIW